MSYTIKIGGKACIPSFLDNKGDKETKFPVNGRVVKTACLSGVLQFLYLYVLIFDKKILWIIPQSVSGSNRIRIHQGK